MRGIKPIVWTCAVMAAVGMLSGQEKERAKTASPPASPGNPLLFLIKDEVVQAELGLTPNQSREIRELTDRLDIPLWGLRDTGPEQGGKKLQELISEAESGLRSILKESQRQRLDQIVMRSQGAAVLLRPDVSDRLKLTSDQQRRIQKIFDGESPSTTTTTAKGKSTSKDKNGSSNKTTANETKRSKESEAKAAMAVLTDSQTRQLSVLLGKPFSLQGYKIKVKAPELAAADAWINSEPLSLEKLRGQVVVLNFWTFG